MTLVRKKRFVLMDLILMAVNNVHTAIDQFQFSVLVNVVRGDRPEPERTNER